MQYLFPISFKGWTIALASEFLPHLVYKYFESPKQWNDTICENDTIVDTGDNCKYSMKGYVNYSLSSKLRKIFY